jgi:hypothetical protein
MGTSARERRVGETTEKTQKPKSNPGQKTRGSFFPKKIIFD